MIKFSMLLAENNRSKAYLQNVLQKGFSPDLVFLLKNEERKRPEQTEADHLFTRETKQSFIQRSRMAGVSFDEKESLASTARKFNIETIVLNTADVNAPETVQALQKSAPEYVVASVPGGTILRKEILNSGKRFIHVHPGLLPMVRGSTAIYYSLLLEGKLGATVILMEEKIDEGPVLHAKTFEAGPKDEDLDYVTDPGMRTAALIEYFEKLRDHQIDLKTLPKPSVQKSQGHTFYIIHPVLKHLALRKYYGT